MSKTLLELFEESLNKPSTIPVALHTSLYDYIRANMYSLSNMVEYRYLEGDTLYIQEDPSKRITVLGVKSEGRAISIRYQLSETLYKSLDRATLNKTSELLEEDGLHMFTNTSRIKLGLIEHLDKGIRNLAGMEYDRPYGYLVVVLVPKSESHTPIETLTHVEGVNPLPEYTRPEVPLPGPHGSN